MTEAMGLYFAALGRARRWMPRKRGSCMGNGNWVVLSFTMDWPKTILTKSVSAGGLSMDVNSGRPRRMVSGSGRWKPGPVA